MKVRSTVILGVLGTIGGLFLMSARNYLLFHTFAEMLGIAVGASIFAIGWTTRALTESQFYALVAASYFVSSILDTLHTLSFSGINVIASDPDMASQFWLVARAIESIGLLLALSVGTFKWTVSPTKVMTTYSLVAVGSTYLILRDRFFDTFIQEQGLTTFKIYSEYGIIAILLGCLYLIYTYRGPFGRTARLWMSGAIVLTIFSEFSFTLYTAPDGFPNFVGHIFKIFSVVMVYRALVYDAVRKPSEIIFQELALSKAALAQRERQYRRLFQHITEGLVFGRMVSDGDDARKDYLILDVNEQFEVMFGVKRKRIIGKKLTEVIPDGGQNWVAVFRRVAKTGESERIEGISFPATGRYFNIVIFTPARDEIALLMIDDTESRLQKERELRLRQNVINSMREQRHDILNELTLASTYVQLNRNDEAQKVLEFIGAHLSEKYYVPTLPDDAWFTIVQNKQAEADNLNITFQTSICPAVPNTTTEGRLLPKLVANLIDNAIDAVKDLDQGFIGVYWEYSGENRVLRVCNNGEPIPSGVLNDIFTPGFSSKGENRGWGLAICRKIANELGGEFAVRSDSSGTEFSLTLAPYSHTDDKSWAQETQVTAS